MVQSAADESGGGVGAGGTASGTAGGGGGSTGGGGGSECAFADVELALPTTRGSSGEEQQEGPGAGDGVLRDATPRGATDDEFVIGEFGRGPAAAAAAAPQAGTCSERHVSERSFSDDEFAVTKGGHGQL